eukprot:GHUV01006121.1.p1 GENE.GHUV01006121.1~~GHUV01006121.1.p1  ORF type:complete len:126 (-),score=15.56 GHUV01006121.1:821-1198(-)
MTVMIVEHSRSCTSVIDTRLITDRQGTAVQHRAQPDCASSATEGRAQPAPAPVNGVTAGPVSPGTSHSKAPHLHRAVHQWYNRHTWLKALVWHILRHRNMLGANKVIPYGMETTLRSLRHVCQQY